MTYRTVKLIFKPTDDQKKSLDAYFVRFQELCQWVQLNCPAEIVKYKSLYQWAYPQLRRKGVFSQMIGKIAGKVSQHRTRKMDMDCNYMLCTTEMFSLRDNKIRVKLIDRKIDVDYEIASGKNTKSQINKCIVQSGVIYKGNEDYVFHLRVTTPKVLTYSRIKSTANSKTQVKYQAKQTH